MTSTESGRQAARGLLSARAVRERCRLLLDAGRAGRLAHFDLLEERLPAAADYVAETIRARYPSLDVPLHARWRHFVHEGRDRWAEIAAGLAVESDERARIRFDLAVTSVLLDAGAGPRWRWRDPRTGRDVARSEGLALASLEAFRNGLFSTARGRDLEADAPGLMRLTRERLAAALQASEANPLEGLDGRVALLNRLGATIMARPGLFGAGGRIGGLYDRLKAEAAEARLPAGRILETLLAAFGPIWPGRISMGGVHLGDTWRHPAVPGDGLVPFHKLSQWLAYSLVEPLEEAGLTVTGLDELTGLAEYRNGGLFLDLGVLVPRDAALPGRRHSAGDVPIVEWRALTVALLDEIAPLVRQRLGRSEEQMPLASVLEGGTWAAGRRLALERRPGGAPPLAIESDGSVF